MFVQRVNLLLKDRLINSYAMNLLSFCNKKYSNYYVVTFWECLYKAIQEKLHVSK